MQLATRVPSLLPLLLLLWSASSRGARSQTSFAVSPGVKVGYTFGDSGGFTFGGELSVVAIFKGGYYFAGGVINYDYCSNGDLAKFHLGVEGGPPLLGIDVGPTWITRGNDRDIGVTIAPFCGLVLFPYYSLTIPMRGGVLSEMGFHAKLPLLVEDHLEFNFIE